MVLLQSMDKFDSIAQLDTVTGQIMWFSRSTDPAIASGPIRGHIACLHGRIVCLYRKDGILHFRVDSADFELTENTRVEFQRLNHKNRITVLRNGISLFSWSYQKPEIFPPLEVDPTPFIEEEHFDFCLFVYNVAKNPARRKRMYL